MKLVVTAFVTLDGVVEAPGFDEHKSGRNAWALRVQGEEDYAYNMAQIEAADAFLLGRRTWQIWAAFWPTAGGDPEVAARVNGMRKYVVSNTLERADWANTTILSGDIASEVRRIKAEPGRELVVYGSPDLVDELLRHDLVDEYRLLFYPVILGAGKHLFRDRIDTHHLRLAGTRTFSSGVVLLTYVPEGAVEPGPVLRVLPVDLGPDPLAARGGGHRPLARDRPVRRRRRLRPAARRRWAIAPGASCSRSTTGSCGPRSSAGTAATSSSPATG